MSIYCIYCGRELYEHEIDADACDECFEEFERGRDLDDEIEDFFDAERERELEFADPGGESSLYAPTPDDPRDQTCPQCRSKNKLTRRDIAAHHICDQCVTSNALDY